MAVHHISKGLVKSISHAEITFGTRDLLSLITCLVLVQRPKLPPDGGSLGSRGFPTWSQRAAEALQAPASPARSTAAPQGEQRNGPGRAPRNTGVRTGNAPAPAAAAQPGAAPLTAGPANGRLLGIWELQDQIQAQEVKTLMANKLQPAPLIIRFHLYMCTERVLVSHAHVYNESF